MVAPDEDDDPRRAIENRNDRIRRWRGLCALSAFLSSVFVAIGVGALLDPTPFTTSKLIPFAVAPFVFLSMTTLLGIIIRRAGPSVHRDRMYTLDIPISSLFHSERLGEILPPDIRMARIEEYPDFSVLRVVARNGKFAIFNSAFRPGQYQRALEWARRFEIPIQNAPGGAPRFMVPKPPQGRLAVATQPLSEMSGVRTLDELDAVLCLGEAEAARKRRLSRRRPVVGALLLVIASVPAAILAAVFYPSTQGSTLIWAVLGSLYGLPTFSIILLGILHINPADLGRDEIFSGRIPLRFLWRPSELGACPASSIRKAIAIERKGMPPALAVEGPRRFKACYGGTMGRGSYEAALRWMQLHDVPIERREM